MICGVCSNPTRGRRRTVYVYRERRLRRVRACNECHRDAVRIVMAPPLQLTKAKAGR